LIPFYFFKDPRCTVVSVSKHHILS
jgi:hypothetical protein